jgi:hypothetical protein
MDIHHHAFTPACRRLLTTVSIVVRQAPTPVTITPAATTRQPRFHFFAARSHKPCVSAIWHVRVKAAARSGRQQRQVLWRARGAVARQRGGTAAGA